MQQELCITHRYIVKFSSELQELDVLFSIDYGSYQSVQVVCVYSLFHSYMGLYSLCSWLYLALGQIVPISFCMDKAGYTGGKSLLACQAMVEPFMFNLMFQHCRSCRKCCLVCTSGVQERMLFLLPTFRSQLLPTNQQSVVFPGMSRSPYLTQLRSWETENDVLKVNLYISIPQTRETLVHTLSLTL